jgi:hypothetical protein
MIVVFQIHGLKYPTFIKFDGDTQLLTPIRIQITHQHGLARPLSTNDFDRKRMQRINEIDLETI